MIDNTRLPVDVERGARGGPGFLTTVVTTSSGFENRNSNWSSARAAYNIGYGIRTKAEMRAVLDFFYARRGRGRGFLFKDWLDFGVKEQSLAPGADNTRRQLVARYGVGDNEYVRLITHPIASTLVVYVNNIAVQNYTLEPNGVVKFTTNPGANVKATFEFDVPVRFDVDRLEVNLEHFDAMSVPNIPVIEVRA